MTDNAQTKYHDGNIIEDTRNALKLQVYEKGANDIASSAVIAIWVDKTDEKLGCKAPLYTRERQSE